MAIGWLSILKAVPWTDVVTNAPKLADGAKKLWETVAKKRSPVEPAGTSTTPVANAATLEVRVAELASEIARLEQEMLDSSLLIKALAEQNAQLVRRAYWQNRILLVIALLAVAALIVASVR